MYKLTLAIRYLLKRRISYFSVFAVALCVFVVLVVITVLSGLTTQFREKIHGTVGDCVVSTKSLVGFPYYQDFLEILEKQEVLEAASPIIRIYALAKSIKRSPGTRYIERALEIVGIEPFSYTRVTGFAELLFYNKANPQSAFKPLYGGDFPGCIVGIGILFDRDSDGDYIIPAQIPNFDLEGS